MVYSYLLNSENEIISLCNYDNGKWQTLRINEELDENGTPLTNDLPPELGDKIINGKLVKKVFNEEEEQKQENINSYMQEMSSIKSWLNANDYIINKHTLGEYTDNNPKWLNYLAERKLKLARYNELETLLKQEE